MSLGSNELNKKLRFTTVVKTGLASAAATALLLVMLVCAVVSVRSYEEAFRSGIDCHKSVSTAENVRIA